VTESKPGLLQGGIDGLRVTELSPAKLSCYFSSNCTENEHPMVCWMVISWNSLGRVDEKYRYLVGIQFGTQLCDTKEREPDVSDSDSLIHLSTPRLRNSVPNCLF